MKVYKILHLMHNEKFIAPFIEFVKEHFNFLEHFFIIVGGVSQDIIKIPNYKNILFLDESYDSKYNYFKYSKLIKPYAQNAEKIILHALFKDNNNFFLFFNQKLLSKCYWVIWGVDLYTYKKQKTKIQDKIRHYVSTKIYSRMGHIITYIKGDYELAQKWYSVNGKHHECFMYPSNLYTEYDIKPKKHSNINIQLGNSADPSNNHIDILEKLEAYKDKNIKIFAPLSYGNKKYSQRIIAKGKEIFEDKFVALTDYMPFEKYIEFLGEIDIAIFAHKRQQAMGNIITLLGLGKKVYMRSDITPWESFKNSDIKLFDLKQEFNLNIDRLIMDSNQEKIKVEFSEENLIKQLENIFKEKNEYR